MQNQAEVNFSKWHFNNSQFSKVDLCQKSNSKVKSEITKVEFLPKSNFKRQISNVKFQVEFPTSNFQSETFQIQLSFKFSKSNFEGRLEVISFKVHHSLKVKQFKFKRLKVKRFKVGFWQAHFKSQHFPSQVNYSFRFDREQTKKKKFDSKIGLQFAFFLSRPSQPRKLSTSASEELAFNQLWRPEDSRQSSAGLFTSPVTCNVWLVEVKKPAWALVRRNVQELGETWWASMRFRTWSKQRRRLEEKEEKNHMVPNSR